MTSPITTHVLDTARGAPASGVPILLEKKSAAGFTVLGQGTTDADGRLRTLLAEGSLEAGVYRITFDIAAYNAAQQVTGFYPEAAIVFEVTEPKAHYHVPLLLSPFGYSTYRGS